MATATIVREDEKICPDCGAIQPTHQFPKYGRGISQYCRDCLTKRLQGGAKRQARQARLLTTASAIARAEPWRDQEPTRVIVATYPLPGSVDAAPEPIIDEEIAALIRAKVREIAAETAREIAREVTREVVNELAPQIARTAIRELLSRVVTAAMN